MAIITESFVDLATTRGEMRVHVFTPQANGPCPGIIFYSEIFQVTGPIRRLAAALAGEGYIVTVPEVYHEFEAPGTVLAYDAEGAERGNQLKFDKELESYDEDTNGIVDWLQAQPMCSGRFASFGVCLGGHLALRAGLHTAVLAAAAFYPTDLHTRTLGRGKSDDTLTRLVTAKVSLLFIFGRQDPHIPVAGRQMIYRELEEAGADMEWHEFNAAHAFLRDEGPRYDPALARLSFALLLRFLAEKLH